MPVRYPLLYEDLTYKLRGCFFNIYNTLGFGHKENVYQKALAAEMRKQGISFEQEKLLAVKYEDIWVGTYKPDFVVEGKILLELKALEFLSKQHEQQIIHYLKTTGYRLGLLVNFGARRLDIRRMIWTKGYKPRTKSVSIRHDRR